MDLNVERQTGRTPFAGLAQKSLGNWKRLLTTRLQPNPGEVDRAEILAALGQAKYELDAAYINFDCADTPELTQVFTYQLKAAQETYNYLTGLAKQHGVIVRREPVIR